MVRDYKVTSRRLVLLGYNATLTTAVEAPRQPKRHFDQIQVGPLRSLSSVDHSCGGAAAAKALLLPELLIRATHIRVKWRHCAAQAAQKYFALP